MKIVHSSPVQTDITMLASFLEGHGIKTETNNATPGKMGGNWAEVLVDEKDFRRAAKLTDEWRLKDRVGQPKTLASLGVRVGVIIILAVIAFGIGTTVLSILGTH